MLGLKKEIQSGVPTDPEKVLGTCIKGVQDLPNRVDMLEDDGVSRIRHQRSLIVEGQVLDQPGRRHHWVYCPSVQSVFDCVAQLQAKHDSNSASALQETFLDLGDPSPS